MITGRTELFGDFPLNGPTFKSQQIDKDYYGNLEESWSLELKKEPEVKENHPIKKEPKKELVQNTTGQRIFKIFSNFKSRKPGPPDIPEKTPSIEPPRKLRTK